MIQKAAEHEFGPDHDLDENPMNWRQGEGLSCGLAAIAGDQKSYRKRLRDKIEFIKSQKGITDE